MPDFFDIHAHLNFVAYDADRDEVIRRVQDSKTWIMNVGTQKDTSKKAVDLANQHQIGVYAAVGLHPIHTSASYHDEKEIGAGGKEFTSRGEVFDVDYYKSLAVDSKVLAIGECGLDYYRLESETEAKQKEAFISQIELANELDKPLMLHIRNSKENGKRAYAEAYEILKSHAKVPADLHFFAGGTKEAELFLDLGFSFSFTGVVTFTTDYDETLKYIPVERIMSETDCPFVTPAPYRGKRNEPFYVSEVVKKIAETKKMPFKELREKLVQNAFKFFNLK